MILKKIGLALKAIKKIDNWWDYFADYLGLKKGYVVYGIKGARIKTRAKSNDKKIITELVLVEPYFPRWLKLRKTPTIVDLGAHIGIFSTLASKKFKDSKIYSIEPVSDNYKLLLEQIKMNKSANIMPKKMAISDKKGKTKIYKGKNFSRSSLIREEGEVHEMVDTITLKDLFEKEKIDRCDLLKIDIEGGEYSVFFSTPKKIFDKIDNIFMELHDVKGHKKIDLINFLIEKGFEIESNKGDTLVYARK